jgi:NADPH:quinone reductase-like Zn-dependent oxidoreductase
VRATSVNAGDWHMLRADPFLMRLGFGLFKPKFGILGADVAGIVEAAGAEVTQFQPGDTVFGDVSGCGFGAFAEYVCAKSSALVRMPANLGFEAAAGAPAAAVTALQGLRDKGRIQAGERVAINGASGGVGTFAVQWAKHFGAEVTAVCSTRNVEQVRELGADHVVDYTQVDFTAAGEQFDLIIGANGDRSIFDYKRALRPGGRYVSTGGSLKQFLQAGLLGPVISWTSGKTMMDFLVKPSGADVAFVAAAIDAGALKVVIDRRYPFAELPEAIRYVEGGHARGKVVVTMADAI